MSADEFATSADPARAAGVDTGSADDAVVRFRAGRDGKSVAPVQIYTDPGPEPDARPRPPEPTRPAARRPDRPSRQEPAAPSRHRPPPRLSVSVDPSWPRLPWEPPAVEPSRILQGVLVGGGLGLLAGATWEAVTETFFAGAGAELGHVAARQYVEHVLSGGAGEWYGMEHTAICDDMVALAQSDYGVDIRPDGYVSMTSYTYDDLPAGMREYYTRADFGRDRVRAQLYRMVSRADNVDAHVRNLDVRWRISYSLSRVRIRDATGLADQGLAALHTHQREMAVRHVAAIRNLLRDRLGHTLPASSQAVLVDDRLDPLSALGYIVSHHDVVSAFNRRAILRYASGTGIDGAWVRDAVRNRRHRVRVH